jgi:hypothetical protein
MSRQAVEELMDRWMNEPEFRQQMKNDPEGTVRATGVELDETEWSALRSMDWNASDEELQARASKYGS